VSYYAEHVRPTLSPADYAAQKIGLSPISPAVPLNSPESDLGVGEGAGTPATPPTRQCAPASGAVETMANLVFNLDGTVSADQLAGLPAELRERVTSPGFIAQARKAIAEARRASGELVKTGRREDRRPIRFLVSHEGMNRRERRKWGL
jgi:hypothetical protein